jgi:hypothetical protein
MRILRTGLILLHFGGGAALWAQQSGAGGIDRARLASQAENFAGSLSNVLCTESLTQKSIRYSTRMRVRVGESVLKPIAPKVSERLIVSEMGYALRGTERAVWQEVRKVSSVDGKPVGNVKQARERLAFGLRNADERARLKMLEEFTQFGLTGMATDYTLSLLLFGPSEIGQMQFEEVRSEFIGAEEVLVAAFHRMDAGAAITIYDRKQATRQPFQGLIWVRKSDMRPVRLRLISQMQQEGALIVDEGTIEYVLSHFGSLVAQQVTYKRIVNGSPVTEILYEYTKHQKFGANADIKFSADPN